MLSGGVFPFFRDHTMYARRHERISAIIHPFGQGVGFTHSLYYLSIDYLPSGNLHVSTKALQLLQCLYRRLTRNYSASEAIVSMTEEFQRTLWRLKSSRGHCGDARAALAGKGSQTPLPRPYYVHVQCNFSYIAYIIYITYSTTPRRRVQVSDSSSSGKAEGSGKESFALKYLIH